MMTRDQIQTVLDALEKVRVGANTRVRMDNAIAILQAALAEPEGEPVAWRFEQGKEIFFLLSKDEVTLDDKENLTPLYEHPVSKPAPLPELQREELLGAISRGWCTDRNMHKIMDSDLAFDIADSILAVAREKANE